MLTNDEQVRTSMRDAGIDALIAWSPSNVRYLTGYWCWLEPVFKEFMVRPGGSGAVAQLSYCLQPLEGDPCLVVEPLWAVDTLGTWVEDVRTPTQGISAEVLPAPNLPSDMARILRLLERVDAPSDSLSLLGEAVLERGLGSSRIGIELEGLPPYLAQELARRLPDGGSPALARVSRRAARHLAVCTLVEILSTIC